MLGALRERRPLWRFLSSFCRGVELAGGESCLVGGIVRDLAEGAPGKDIDIMVSRIGFGELGLLLRSLSAKALGVRRVLCAGKAFPVYKVRAAWADGDIDVAIARTKDGDPREDAARRDFTVNSLLFPLRTEGGRLTGSLVDQFGGIRDLERNLIRGTGNPGERFREDPVRMLRAVRLKNERRGSSIERGTWRAILRAAPALVRSVPGERIAAELLRSLSANPSGATDDLFRAGILRILLPEPGAVTARTVEGMKRRFRYLERTPGRPLPPTLLFANLLYDLAAAECRKNLAGAVRAKSGAKEATLSAAEDRRIFRLAQTEAAARRLRLPSVRSIVRLLEDRNRLAHSALFRHRLARLESLLLRWEPGNLLLHLDAAVRNAEGGRKKGYRGLLARAADRPPLLTGRDLIEAGIPSGPRVEAILEEIRDATLSGRIRRRDQAMKMAALAARAAKKE